MTDDNDLDPPDELLTGARINDIASAAGISVSTVSRVINGRRDVAEQTRERVQSVIAELSYSPNPGARRLRSGRTHTVAIVYPFETDKGGFEFAADIVRGAAATAEARNYVASLITSPLTPAKLRRLYESNQADGTIILEVAMDDWRVNLLKELELPFVALGRPTDHEDLLYVDLDFSAAMTEALEFLKSLGHEHVAMLGHESARHDVQWGPAVRSEAAFLETSAALFGSPGPYIQVEQGSDDAVRAVDELLDHSGETTAIIAANTVSIPGVVWRLAEHGRSVPRDVAIVSTTTDVFAELMTPTLTTVNFDQFEAGGEACELLMDVIDEKPPRSHRRLLSPRLTIRASS